MTCLYLKTGKCLRTPDPLRLHADITRMIQYHLGLNGVSITTEQASNVAAQIVTSLPEIGGRDAKE